MIYQWREFKSDSIGYNPAWCKFYKQMFQNLFWWRCQVQSLVDLTQFNFFISYTLEEVVKKMFVKRNCTKTIRQLWKTFGRKNRLYMISIYRKLLWQMKLSSNRLICCCSPVINDNFSRQFLELTSCFPNKILIWADLSFWFANNSTRVTLA